jgi:hypothetical protein
MLVLAGWPRLRWSFLLCDGHEIAEVVRDYAVASDSVTEVEVQQLDFANPSNLDSGAASQALSGGVID